MKKQSIKNLELNKRALLSHFLYCTDIIIKGKNVLDLNSSAQVEQELKDTENALEIIEILIKQQRDKALCKE